MVKCNSLENQDEALASSCLKLATPMDASTWMRILGATKFNTVMLFDKLAQLNGVALNVTLSAIRRIAATILKSELLSDWKVWEYGNKTKRFWPLIVNRFLAQREAFASRYVARHIITDSNSRTQTVAARRSCTVVWRENDANEGRSSIIIAKTLQKFK